MMNKERILELLHSNNEDDIKLGCIILVRSAVNQEEIENIIGKRIGYKNYWRRAPAIIYKYNKKMIYLGIGMVRCNIPYGVNPEIINLDEENEE